MNSIGSCDGQRVEEEAPKKPNDDVVIDIQDDYDRPRNSESSNTAEAICRICHEFSSESTQLIKLGCDCKGEIGFVHHECATIWFSSKGNYVCEICGKVAKNFSNNNNMTMTSTTTMLMPMPVPISSERSIVAEPSDEDIPENKELKIIVVAFFMLGVFLLPYLFILLS